MAIVSKTPHRPLIRECSYSLSMITLIEMSTRVTRITILRNRCYTFLFKKNLTPFVFTVLFFRMFLSVKRKTEKKWIYLNNPQNVFFISTYNADYFLFYFCQKSMTSLYSASNIFLMHNRLSSSQFVWNPISLFSNHPKRF